MGFARQRFWWRRREGGSVEAGWEGGDGGRPVRPDGAAREKRADGVGRAEGGGSREIVPLSTSRATYRGIV
jgi:hypothetical protein